ncbi:hypothetical protein GIB67_026456 [Kingdonia uniflora]|uniref:Uncharacterized protein n=1 Tax=Kingdonia uniflora TaxID=39325 RepID=A0A7J7P705_9MAGN|nr:hypothetical protein GIB67_026456 [Kingdonia uniflora]
MPLHKTRLTGALKKLHLKTATINKRDRTAPSSPTSILSLNKDDSDDDYPFIGYSSSSSQSSNVVPHDVQKGFFAVYVGLELTRYVIPLNFLKHPVFVTLLRRAEEEFGFRHTEAIRLPCEPVLFDHLLWLLNRNDPLIKSLELDELLQFYQ